MIGPDSTFNKSLEILTILWLRVEIGASGRDFSARICGNELARPYAQEKFVPQGEQSRSYAQPTIEKSSLTSVDSVIIPIFGK